MTTPLDSYMTEQAIDDADFGKLIGRDRSMVSKIRRGVIRPTLTVAARIEQHTAGKVTMQSWVDGFDDAGDAASLAVCSTCDARPDSAEALACDAVGCPLKNRQARAA